MLRRSCADPKKLICRDDHSKLEQGYRKAVNSRVQGSAADLMKAAMVAVEQWAVQQRWTSPRPVRCECSMIPVYSTSLHITYAYTSCVYNMTQDGGAGA